MVVPESRCYDNRRAASLCFCLLPGAPGLNHKSFALHTLHMFCIASEKGESFSYTGKTTDIKLLSLKADSGGKQKMNKIVHMRADKQRK